MSDHTEQIRDFILSNFLFGDSTQMPLDSDSLVDSGVVDSTGILELLEFLESNFGIQITESQTIPENLDSVADLSRFVLGKAKAA
jgi:acyl carrier protein